MGEKSLFSNFSRRSFRRNSTEIEISNLGTPYYDVERFGISFVASPRHADVLLVTGAVTLKMAEAVKKTYEAMPSPKFVVAVGDDACDGGIYRGSYAVLGGVDKILLSVVLFIFAEISTILFIPYSETRCSIYYRLYASETFSLILYRNTIQ